MNGDVCVRCRANHLSIIGGHHRPAHDVHGKKIGRTGPRGAYQALEQTGAKGASSADRQQKPFRRAVVVQLDEWAPDESRLPDGNPRQRGLHVRSERVEGKQSRIGVV